MRQNVIHASAAVAALALGVMLATQVSAAPAASGTSAGTMVLYSETRSLTRVDNNSPGTTDGDTVYRELALSKTLGGPVIGVGYSQSEVTEFNIESKIDTRRVEIEDFLPGGKIFSLGTTRLVIGVIPPPGWHDTYAIVGGTGKYAGARGTLRMTELQDGKTFKVLFTFLK